jgi:hypothetical protein
LERKEDSGRQGKPDIAFLSRFLVRRTPHFDDVPHPIFGANVVKARMAGMARLGLSKPDPSKGSLWFVRVIITNYFGPFVRTLNQVYAQNTQFCSDDGVTSAAELPNMWRRLLLALILGYACHINDRWFPILLLISLLFNQ